MKLSTRCCSPHRRGGRSSRTAIPRRRATSSLLGAWPAWSAGRDQQRLRLPYGYTVLGLFLLSVAAHYSRSRWGHYFYNHPLWWSGVASILIVSLLSLLACLAARGRKGGSHATVGS